MYFCERSKASEMVIICTISIFGWIGYDLFDLKFNYSYVSIQFTVGMNLVCDILDSPVYVSTLVGESVLVTHV